MISDVERFYPDYLICSRSVVTRKVGPQKHRDQKFRKSEFRKCYVFFASHKKALGLSEVNCCGKSGKSLASS